MNASERVSARERPHYVANAECYTMNENETKCENNKTNKTSAENGVYAANVKALDAPIGQKEEKFRHMNTPNSFPFIKLIATPLFHSSTRWGISCVW